MAIASRRAAGGPVANVAVLTSAVLFVLGVIGLVALSVAAHNLPDLPGDVAISHAMQAYQAGWVDTATVALSWTGFPPQSNVILGLIVVVMVVLGARWMALIELLVALGTVASYFLLEGLVGQPRPSADLVRVMGPIQMTGYPSGHVATFTVVFGFVAFAVYRRLWPSPTRWLPVALVLVLLVCLSFARIYSGHHWASGVVAGCLLGGLWLELGVWLYLWGEARFHRSPRVQPAWQTD